MDTDPQRTVDFYVRANAPAVERRDSVVERLTRAVREERIDGFDVHVWPKAISLDTTRGGDIYETVRSFEEWALRRGCHVRPCFGVRTVHSTIVGETDDQLVLPVLCVAAYVDGDLVALAPCRDGESTFTVEDVLDAIVAGEGLVPDISPGAESDHGRRDTAETGTEPTEGT